MRIPSYTSPLVLGAANTGVSDIGYRFPIVYATKDTAKENEVRGSYLFSKAKPMTTGYRTLTRLFRYSRRRPRKIGGKKTNCGYCGGAPNDKPVFATASGVSRGEIKMFLAPHCQNCRAAVA